MSDSTPASRRAAANRHFFGGLTLLVSSVIAAAVTGIVAGVTQGPRLVAMFLLLVTVFSAIVAAVPFWRWQKLMFSEDEGMG